MTVSLRQSLLISPFMAIALGIPVLASAQPNYADDEGFSSRTAEVQPYIEAAQVLTAELSPGDDIVTYTSLAAGVDAMVAGRNSAGSVSVRYERRIGYGDVADGDAISGIARGSLALVPRSLTIEAGALASRARVEAGGATTIGGNSVDDSATSQIYSLYAGPSLQTNVGDLEVTSAYRIGYTSVEAPNAIQLAPDDDPVDIFDNSLTQQGNVRAGFAPGTVLPIGIGVGAGWNRQDVSNLDQRIDDRYVRGDVTVPVSRTLALTGGVGYEDVEVSSRDALRDVNSEPVTGADGRLVTDKSVPRQIAYQTDGLIWDAGVMWRPSDRTAVQAVYGRRYGSSTYYGSLSYAPNPRTSVNVGVYDNLTGFGGSLVDNLANLPTEFSAFRNMLTGDLGGCVDSLEGGSCALANLGSLRSSAFRNRGVTASVSRSTGRVSYGIAGGYDRRSFFGAPNTALEDVNSVLNENYWAAIYATRQMDLLSSLSANAFVNWFESGYGGDGDGMGYSASLSYNRQIIRGLSGTAAVGVDGIERDVLPDYTNASALVGLRYSF